MGERSLLNGMRCGAVPSISFTDNINVRYFDQTWLRKTMDIGAGMSGNVN
ncbi:MAG: hypothetical protein WB564_03770 [Dehalococcoidia bacterium]